MGELGEAVGWEGLGVGETRKEAKMEKWLLWSEAKGVGMVEPMEKTGPKEEEQERKNVLSQILWFYHKAIVIKIIADK